MRFLSFRRLESGKLFAVSVLAVLLAAGSAAAQGKANPLLASLMMLLSLLLHLISPDPCFARGICRSVAREPSSLRLTGTPPAYLAEGALLTALRAAVILPRRRLARLEQVPVRRKTTGAARGSERFPPCQSIRSARSPSLRLVT